MKIIPKTKRDYAQIQWEQADEARIDKLRTTIFSRRAAESGTTAARNVEKITREGNTGALYRSLTPEKR